MKNRKKRFPYNESEWDPMISCFGPHLRPLYGQKQLEHIFLHSC